MESKPLISVVITTYERDNYLEKAIESVIREVNDNALVEIIVLDNASNNTNIEHLARLYGVNKFIKNSTNLGLFGNWNKAFEVSSGEYVYIMGDDDVMLSGFVKGCLLAIHNNPGIDIVYTDYQAIDENDSITGLSMPSPFGLITKDFAIKYALRFGLGLPTISMCYRKSLFDDNGYDERNFGSNDWYYLYTTMPWTNAYGISEQLLAYRKHGGGASDKYSHVCAISRFILLWKINKHNFFWSKCFALSLIDAFNSVFFLNQLGYEQNNTYVKGMNDLLAHDHKIKLCLNSAYPAYKLIRWVKNRLVKS